MHLNIGHVKICNKSYISRKNKTTKGESIIHNPDYCDLIHNLERGLDCNNPCDRCPSCYTTNCTSHVLVYGTTKIPLTQKKIYLPAVSLTIYIPTFSNRATPKWLFRMHDCKNIEIKYANILNSVDWENIKHRKLKGRLNRAQENKIDEWHKENFS